MVSRSPQQDTLATTENHPSHGANPWSTYWASGALHSCAGSFEGNYDGVLAQLWTSFFRSLPEGARILDLASGNGPLAQLMLTSTPGSEHHCTCIDLAEVYPSWISKLPEKERSRIHFRPQTAMEQLGAEGGQFDAVISQYGVEYGNWESMIERLVSLLRPNGRIHFVCHAASSAILLAGQAEATHLDWVLAPMGLLDTARAMLPLMALAGTDAGRTTLASSSAAQETRVRYDQLLSEANNRALRLPVGDILAEIDQHCANAFKAALSGDITKAKTLIATLQNHLVASRARLSQLSAAALSEQRLMDITAAFKVRGIQLSYQPIREEDRLLGWQITN